MHITHAQMAQNLSADPKCCGTAAEQWWIAIHCQWLYLAGIAQIHWLMVTNPNQHAKCSEALISFNADCTPSHYAQWCHFWQRITAQRMEAVNTYGVDTFRSHRLYQRQMRLFSAKLTEAMQRKSPIFCLNS